MTIQDCKGYLFKLLVYGALFSQQIMRSTDAIITWTLPSPQRGPLQTSDTSVRTTIQQVINGSSEERLMWNFTLSGEILDRVFWEIGGVRIGKKTSSGIVSIDPTSNFREHFDISRSDPATLIIYNVTEADEAEFACKVETDVKTWNDKIDLKIVAPPVITDILGERTLNDSDLANLICNVDGKPTPNVTWTRVSDSKPVKFPFNISGIEDQGLYRCTADNGIGNSISRDVFITVQYYHPINTRLNTDLSGKTVSVNITGTFNITCSAQANPAAKYRFYKNQENFINDTTGRNVSVISTSVSERIKKVNYSCTPFNDFGHGPTEVITLIVFYAPSSTQLIAFPNNTTLLHGSNMSLNCNTDANPEDADYHFYFNGSRIGNSSSGVFNVTVKADGVYTCVPVNTVGTGDNATVSITVVVAPSVKISHTTATVVEGNNLTLTCNPSGKPDPGITWTKLGSSSMLSNTSTLAIVNVSRPDNMIQYQCTASNGVGTPATATVNVTVHFPPEINYATPDYQVVEGNGTILFCNATGNPKPNITWTKQGNNSELSTSETLNLTNLMREDDGSVYKCTATNKVGSAHATATITVFFPPKSTIHNCTSQATEAYNVTFYCNATGNPPPEVAWIRSGEVLVKDSAYVIPAINRSQAGVYECLAWNGIGSNSTANCTVDVQYPPTSTIIDTVPSNTTVLRYTSLSLKCTTDANPDAHIYHFYLNGNLIGNSSSGVFNVTVNADGVYTCVPVNTVSAGDNAIVNVTAVAAPVAEVTPQNSTVNEGKSINITCNVDGDPFPSIHWTMLGSSDMLSNTSSLTVLNVSRPGTPDNMIQYQCTASNGVEKPATDIASVTVHYPPGMPTLTTVPSNRTLLRGSIMSLNCATDASPEAEYYFYFNGNSIGSNGSGVLNVTVKENGTYTCVPINTFGTGGSATVSITAVVAPSVEISNTTATVVEGKNLILTCNASGKPEPSITWTKVGSSEVLSNTSSLTVENVSRPGTPDNMIQYQCRASNGVGTPATATATINVQYPPSIIGPRNETFNLTNGKEVNFSCIGEGNPRPTVHWTLGGDVIDWIPEGNVSNLTFQGKPSSSGLYRCTIMNYLGKDFKLFHLIMEGKVFLIMIRITNKGCSDNPQQVSEQLRLKVLQVLPSVVIEVKHYTCGSVTVYFLLEFTQSVAIPKVLSILKNAAESKGFGEFKVDSGSIQAISDDQLPTDASAQGPSSTTKKSSDSPCTESFIQEANCDIKVLSVVVIAVVVVIVIFVVIGVVAWCVHKKRKCRKNNGVGSTPSEEQPFSRQNSTPVEDGPYSRVNNGYAEAGPRPTELTDMGQHLGASAAAAVPDKKGKTDDKKDAEQKPQAEPDYAQVDKSKKKKKKEEPDATYAQVDMSKKSKKKKANPGEVLYADLGDFNQMKEMPKVSTSPQPLPPIKKPTPYVETQYADITQFLKGDATLPDSKDSQEPATGNKEDAPAANKGESEGGSETFF